MKNYFFVLLIFLFSCEKPSDCDDHYFSDDFKSYVFADAGSQWIFQDTILGITDTITITLQEIQFNEECSFSSQPHEVVEHTITSSYFVQEDGRLWHGRGDAQGDYYDGGYMLGFYYKDDNIYHDSLLVAGVWYKDVIEFSTDYVKFYRAKDIGVIKRKFEFFESSDTTYNFQLVSYVVIK